MAATVTYALRSEIERRLNELPAESLAPVIDFLDYLKFKREREKAQAIEQETLKPSFRVVARLEGLLKGYTISDEEIAAARWEMWERFGEREPWMVRDRHSCPIVAFDEES